MSIHDCSPEAVARARKVVEMYKRRTGIKTGISWSDLVTDIAYEIDAAVLDKTKDLELELARLKYNPHNINEDYDFPEGIDEPDYFKLRPSRVEKKA